MKHIIFILSIIFFISCTDAKKIKKAPKTDLQKFSLNGKVKSIEEKWFDATEKFGKPEKLKIRDWEITSFDKLGNKIEEKSLYEDGRICSIKTYKYNNENKIIGETFTCGDRHDEAFYKYDKRGNNIDLTYYSDGKIMVKHVKKFDQNNNEIDFRLYQSDGVLDSKILSKFDSDNFKIEEEVYSFNGVTCAYTGKKTLEYDENGNVIQEKNFDEKGNLESVYKYGYDEKGNEIEKVFSKGNIEKKTIRKINKFGGCQESYEYSNGIIKDKYRSVIKYDSNGNYIVRTNYTNEIVNGITERNIEYFD